MTTPTPIAGLSHCDAPSTPEIVAEPCPVCGAVCSVWYATIDGYEYFRCLECESLYIDPAALKAIDAGESTRKYDATYWVDELRAAKERSKGASLVRVAEAILYARRPVHRFLDVGTGPGYLLDALTAHCPNHAGVFHGVELFPPKEHSSHPNYNVGGLETLNGRFDAGVCIEVVEHLTPRMLSGLASSLAHISEPNALWLFNSGMPDLVLTQDPGYLDPLRRGHIVSYGLAGIGRIFGRYGFRVSAIPGKNYAWLAEFRPASEMTIDERLGAPVPENLEILQESGLMLQAGFESCAASRYMHEALVRAKWALGLDAELGSARAMYADLQNEHERVGAWAHALSSELNEARTAYGDLQSEHESVAQLAHALDRELTDTRTKNMRLRDELGALRGENEKLSERTGLMQRAYDEIAGSTSWKMTWPLRAAGQRLKVLYRNLFVHQRGQD